jgi:hypothetical protein
VARLGFGPEPGQRSFTIALRTGSHRMRSRQRLSQRKLQGKTIGAWPIPLAGLSGAVLARFRPPFGKRIFEAWRLNAAFEARVP